MLEMHNISEQITSYTEVPEALNYFHGYQPNGQLKKSLILLDIHMPGIDGFSFLEEFAKLNPALRRTWSIYMLSSSISPVDIKRAEAHPLVTGYVMKPLTESFFNQFK
jgi:CheY-like chemotaxis protein